MTPAFVVVPLEKTHDRDGFSCGVEALDRYFRQQVTQDIRRRIASCFVAVERIGGMVAGYYTLAATGIALTSLPEEVRRKLPRYPSVPAVRMGRLAVAEGFAGQGLGVALLADALARTTASDIAAYALIVDAKDERAANFYRHHGFRPFEGNPLMLYFPLGGLGRLVE